MKIKMNLVLVVCALISCCRWSHGKCFTIDHLQEAVLRNRRYAFQKPETCNLNGDLDNLCFYGSKTVPYQMAVLNVSMGTGIVVDPMSQKVAILDGRQGRGIILDRETNRGIKLSSPKLTVKEFPYVLSNYNVSHAFHSNPQDTFYFDQYGVKESPVVLGEKFVVDDLLTAVLLTFGHDFYKHVLKTVAIAGAVALGVMQVFHEIMKPVLEIFAPIVILATVGFLTLKAGMMAIWKIFKTLAGVVLKIVGGIAAMVAVAVSIPLGVILVALNGLLGFFLVLYELAKHFNLAAILGLVLATPLLIFEVIAGMGGMVLLGAAGLFTIVFHMISLLAKGVLGLIKEGMKMIFDSIMSFFGLKVKVVVSYADDIKPHSDLLIDLVNNQNDKYNMHTQLAPLGYVSSGLSGNEKLELYGVDVGRAVKILADPTISDAVSMATQVSNLFLPLNIPNMVTGMISGIFRSSVDLLSSPRNAEGIEMILPGLQPDSGSSLRFSPDSAPPDNATTLELIDRNPVIKEIFTKLNVHASKTYNVSLVDELNSNPEFDMEIRQVLSQP